MTWDDEPGWRRGKGQLGRRTLLKLGMASGLAGSLGGCFGADGETPTERTALPGSLVASPGEGQVGDSLRLEGTSLPERERLDLVWGSVEGRWPMSDGSSVIRPYYESTEKRVGRVQTDGDGSFAWTWEFPEDYGGEHPIEVRREGEPLARTVVRIRPSFTIDRQRAPLGSFFEVTGRGLGTGEYTSLYEIAWDNGTAGLLTAVTTDGTATARVPAAGPPGSHVLRVGRGWTGVLYLNLHQSPYEPPDFETWTVEVTEPDELPDPWTDEVGSDVDPPRLRRLREAQYPEAPRPEGDPSLVARPTVAAVGDALRLSGDGFHTGETVELVWYSKRGNRVEASGFATHVETLGTARATDGRLEFETTVPDDLGGVHPIVARVGDEPVAATTVVVRPSIVGVEPAAGPVGTRFSVHLKGVGWTEYDNGYSLLYDNRLLGYACGFNSQGDVKIPLTAAGAPGPHTIDLYPMVYQAVRDPSYPDFYNKPQLSYRTDHPGRPQPAHHAAFWVTAE